jgi:hypothetical protein
MTDNTRIGVVFLGVIAVLSICGATAIVLVTEKTVPDFMVASGSAAISAIAALLYGPKNQPPPSPQPPQPAP